MCTGAEIAILSAVSSAGGMYMQNEAANDAANERRNIAAAAEAESQKIGAESERTVNDFAQKTFDPTKREQNYEQAADEREISLAQALSSAGGETTGASGAVSSEYLSGRDASAAASSAEAAKRAKLLARTGAGGLLGNREAMMGGQLSSDLAGIGAKSARNSRYANNAINNVGPGTSLAGGLMSGLGAAGMSSAGGMMAGGGGFGVTNRTGLSLPTRGGM